ncbi:glycoside hydrolase family 3 N-terminal domain-containing protein [Curtobacterium sp. BRB10]|uniref:glycoside hydrolase family 3 N-terminal domain-containing protein n=1 Tax=Curtobacterium sp. BRB10 TaxID=2962579 RepID=UPI0028813D5A|nr:glycoside hydrolase family 3 N-terminal domain-containing protein [Curtobacterium sp. BRB10]MDT0234845.1 glycoside hydrolase family 3 N-terminal domain-containing protein [Curtobacterium sp. BRB10]
MSTAPYRDPDLTVEARVADLLTRMTVEEKAGQLSQYFYMGTGERVPDDFDLDSLPPEHRAFVEQPRMVERAVASGGAGSVLFVREPNLANRLQRSAVEDTRLGIPLLFGFDVVHGLRTIFPVPIALAASWDPELIEAVQGVAARESRAVGIHWTFAPMVDVTRDARWGRIIEGAGEDPVLGAAVAAAQVRGFQGDLDDEHVLAGPKHLVGYGAARGGRDYDDADVSDADLWNVYLPPFRAAVEAGAANVMSAYMDLNGVPASANRWLLTDVLRGELGFDGWVVSDANAVRSLEVQHFAKDQTDAAARALDAGLDMEMTTFEPAFANLPAAVRDGLVDEAVLDRAVARVLTAKFRLGLFERPFVDAAAAAEVLDAPEHRELARTAAERSVVLLKNEGALLPLSDTSAQRVAVIGQLADSKRDTIGPWVFEHDTAEAVSIVDGLRHRLGDDARIEHAPGVGIPGRVHPSPFDAMDPSVQPTPADHDDDRELDRAVAAAAGADLAVVVVGQPQNQIGEKASVSTLDLPGRQQEQLERIVATGTPVVLVVLSGRPLDLRWADEHVPTILQAWYPGTRGGDAVAAVLFGDAEPAGRLPFTWPRHVGQVPATYAHLRTFAPEDQDARYFDGDGAPLYRFGHGLTYATFAYAGLTVGTDRLPVGETTTVSVDVTNTSARDGEDVVQLYVHQRHGTSSRPVRELKGFQRVAVPAGATRTVTFELGPDQLSYWSAATRGVVQDTTTIDIWAGGDSAATLHTELEVSA